MTKERFLGYLIVIFVAIIVCILLPGIYEKECGVPRQYVRPRSFWIAYWTCGFRKWVGCIIDEVAYKIKQVYGY